MVNYKKYKAHRFAYKLFVGELIPGLKICHTCDNPLCVNPKHLYQGTQKQNMTDKVLRNRNPQGSQHTNAKLSMEQVEEIRQDSRYQKDIAADYGVNQRTISRIKRGERYLTPSETSGGVLRREEEV